MAALLLSGKIIITVLVFLDPDPPIAGLGTALFYSILFHFIPWEMKNHFFSLLQYFMNV